MTTPNTLPANGGVSDDLFDRLDTLFSKHTANFNNNRDNTGVRAEIVALLTQSRASAQGGERAVCPHCKGQGGGEEWISNENDRSGQSDYRAWVDCAHCNPNTPPPATSGMKTPVPDFIARLGRMSWDYESGCMRADEEGPFVAYSDVAATATPPNAPQDSQVGDAERCKGCAMPDECAARKDCLREVL